MADDPPLDEIQWKSPPHIQQMGGFLHSNNILFYFAESPFFDPTSNNASLTVQATYNPAYTQYVETREAFEARLRTMSGLEYIVAYDPLQTQAKNADGQFAAQPSNVWVIRKQQRRKRPGMDDEVSVLATYFVVGENIYMAPSVASVVSSRLLSTVTSLNKFLSTASSLPVFSPSYGHAYIPPVSKASDTQPSSQPRQSKESTPMPGSQSQPSSFVSAASTTSTTDASQTLDLNTLADSFRLSSRYATEYMDENPLVGEPGNFIISRSTQNSQSQKQPPALRNALAADRASKSPAPTPPPQIKTDLQRKSGLEKASEKSPITPGKLKRKKTKTLTPAA